jgi:subtilisin family serine protease
MLKSRLGLRRIDPLFSAPKLEARTRDVSRTSRGLFSLAASVEESPRERLRGYSMIHLGSKDISDADLKRIGESSAVRFVERVPNRWISRKPTKVDPSLNLQWGLRAIGWFAARKLPNASSVHVAVLDTGVDAQHPDLKGMIAHYDSAGHSRKDLPGHGTHVAGIIAARANNGIGIAGIANCQLHVWKVFTDPLSERSFEKFDDEAYNKALGAVLDSPAKIINLSLGGTERSRTEEDLISALVDEGALVVAAMGNGYEEGNETEYPAAYPDVLAVGAISETKRRTSFSSTGRHIGLVAPGNSILSTVPMYPFTGRAAEYDAWPGTSMAAPHVAGCAALLKAKYRSRTGKWIAQRLMSKAVRLPGMKGATFTTQYGRGLVSISRAI